MFAPKNLLCAALAAGLFFSASDAEARFGKRSNSSDSDQKEEKKKKDKEERDERPAPRVHDASAVNSSRTHGASPVGSSRPPPPPPPREHVVVVEPAPEPVYYAEPVPPPPSYYVAPVSEPVEVRAPRQDTLFSPLRIGLEGGPSGGGTRMNVFLAIEGEQLGVEGRLTGLSLPTDDGTSGSDTLSVVNAHLTYALVAQEKLRWRLEAGLSSAHAPDLTVYGPSLGTSFEVRLGGPLDFELRLQGTPFPYRQADAQAALALKLHPWVVRAGWRTLLLNDAGLVDGEVHQDIFSGPFLGAGLFF